MLDRPSSLQHVVEYKGNFGTWAVRNAEQLFLPKRESGYSLNAIIYILAKRVHLGSYEQLLRMSEEDRDEFFELELKVMEDEAKSAKTKK